MRLPAGARLRGCKEQRILILVSDTLRTRIAAFPPWTRQGQRALAMIAVLAGRPRRGRPVSGRGARIHGPNSGVHRRAGAQRWGQEGRGAATGKGGRWAPDDGGLRGEAGAGQGGARGDAIGQSSRVHRRVDARRQGVKTRIASGRLAAESGAVFKVDGGG